MLSEILLRNESKTLEFKENATSTLKIIKTVIAFANTAGGIVVIGVEDKTKKIIGVENILQEEERLSNIIADSIVPMLIPDIEIINHAKKELLIINVPYLVGPYYYKKAGLSHGAYIRLGSTNRLADSETLAALLRAEKQISFDETPCLKASEENLDDLFISKTLGEVHKKLTRQHYLSLGLTEIIQKKVRPTYGALLLFSSERLIFLPDSIIRCVCYAGNSREKIIDQKDIASNLILAVTEIINFIDRHTSISSKIGKVTREDTSQFPPVAIREAVINALVHADYSIMGSSIQVAVFADRVEITNPGSLPFGQSLESALSGISKVRNKVIGKVFRELRLIERLGSGIPRILSSYIGEPVGPPKFEEIDNHFRVTLFALIGGDESTERWKYEVIEALSGGNQLATKRVAELWGVTERTARIRLKVLCEIGLLVRIAKSETDPTARYGLANVQKFII